jgi:RNA recognition motif-containing protein
MKIIVASLPFNVMEADLLAAFSEFGLVDSIKIITNKHSGRSKGVGFIEMPDAQCARRAINELNGAEVKGRTIVVNQSQETRQNEDIGFRNHYDHNTQYKLHGKPPRKPILL